MVLILTLFIEEVSSGLNHTSTGDWTTEDLETVEYSTESPYLLGTTRRTTKRIIATRYSRTKTYTTTKTTREHKTSRTTTKTTKQHKTSRTTRKTTRESKTSTKKKPITVPSSTPNVFLPSTTKKLTSPSTTKKLTSPSTAKKLTSPTTRKKLTSPKPKNRTSERTVIQSTPLVQTAIVKTLKTFVTVIIQKVSTPAPSPRKRRSTKSAEDMTLGPLMLQQLNELRDRSRIAFENSRRKRRDYKEHDIRYLWILFTLPIIALFAYILSVIIRRKKYHAKRFAGGGKLETGILDCGSGVAYKLRCASMYTFHYTQPPVHWFHLNLNSLSNVKLNFQSTQKSQYIELAATEEARTAAGTSEKEKKKRKKKKKKEMKKKKKKKKKKGGGGRSREDHVPSPRSSEEKVGSSRTQPAFKSEVKVITSEELRRKNWTYIKTPLTPVRDQFDAKKFTDRGPLVLTKELQGDVKFADVTSSKEITKVEFDEGLNEIVGIGSCVEVITESERKPSIIGVQPTAQTNSEIDKPATKPASQKAKMKEVGDLELTQDKSVKSMKNKQKTGSDSQADRKNSRRAIARTMGTPSSRKENRKNV
ncbi:hypothetical protein RB195_012762 [Necator americanus]|uniref:Zonadhesin n=1 Tax=Necator americanus TaxID=51031 RepID=A0ABR1DSY2_NECAM